MEPPPKNTLGLVSFIVSILGVLTCGVLSPVALLLGLPALFRPRKGFAIAGTVLGAVGSVVLLLFGAAFLLGLLAVADMSDQLATESAIETAERLVGEWKEQHDGRIPDPQEGAALIGHLLDGWSRPLAYEAVSETEYRVVSGGKDMRVGTADDQDWAEVQRRRAERKSSSHDWD